MTGKKLCYSIAPSQQSQVQVQINIMVSIGYSYGVGTGFEVRGSGLIEEASKP